MDDKILITIVPICLLSIINLPTLTITCEAYRFVENADPQALEGHVIKTVSYPIVNLCWGDCVWLPWCFSINVRRTSEEMFECELNNSSKKANPHKMVTREGWSYHEMAGLNEATCKLNECKRKEDLGEGWRRYGDAAIKLFTEKKTWSDARSHCQSLGGDLLSITSSHENDFVNEVFVEDLNLTYIQEDKALSIPHVHFRLNGQEKDIQLLGTPGDARYEADGRETTLFFNGQKGYAKIPSINLNPNAFFIAMWMKASPFSESWVKPLGIRRGIHPLLQTKLSRQIYHMYYRVNLGNNVVKGFFGARLTPETWQHIAIGKLPKSTQNIQFAYQGRWSGNVADVSSMDITNSDSFLLGTDVETFANGLAYHGNLKHLVFVNDSISEHQLQTIMHWHEQGVWIGLNYLANSGQFSWSDGTSIGQFMNLQGYGPVPTASGRKCIAMAKDRKWLDKHCHLKYPFLCEKKV